MNRFTPRLESLDGRVMPSAIGIDVPGPYEGVLHARDDLPETISFAPAGGLRGGVVLTTGEPDHTGAAGNGYEAQKGSKGEEIPM